MLGLILSEPELEIRCIALGYYHQPIKHNPLNRAGVNAELL